METSTLSDLQTKGQQLYAAGDYQGALEVYRQWTETSPVSSDAWRMLGFAQYACQQYSEAVASFGRATNLKPDNPENHFGLGLAYKAVSDLDHSVESLDEAIRLRSDHGHAKSALVDTLLRRAQSYFAQNNNQYGEHDLDRAVKLDRKSPIPVMVFAKHLVDTGQQPRAAKLIQQALLDLPTDSQVLAVAQQLGVSATTAAVAEAQKKEQIRQSQETQCPACKKTIMNWASVCPYCSTVIKQIPSSFAGRDTGPSTTWQEVAYKVLAAVWILYGAWTIYGGVQLKTAEFYFPGMEAPFVIFGTVMIAVGIGLFTESEVMQFIAKIFCLLVFCNVGLGFKMGGTIRRGFLLEAVISLFLAGFQLYLLKEVGGD